MTLSFSHSHYRRRLRMYLHSVPFYVEHLDQQIPSYQGRKTRDFLHWIMFDSCRRVEAAGLRKEELPSDLFEAQVFLMFLYGVSGEYTVNGSAFGGCWRWIPAAEAMARKIGAESLATEFAETWAEVRKMPEDLLGEYDGGRVVWRQPDIDTQKGRPQWAFRSQAIPDQLGERMQHVLDLKWQASVDQTLIAKPIAPPGDGLYRLENAVAAYLSNKGQPIDWYETKESFEDRVSEIVESFDDYEIRLSERGSRTPLSDLEQMVRARRPQTNHRILRYPDQLRIICCLRTNSETVAEDGLLISEVSTTQGNLIVAYFRDKAQLIEPKAWSEIATTNLENRFSSHPKAKARLSYTDLSSWQIGDRFRPLIF